MHGLIEALTAIWRLTLPYFVSRDVGEVHLWPFGRFRMQERWIALFMVAIVVAISFGLVAISVRLTYFNRDWFNAIQDKDAAAFWTLLFSVFCFWAVIYITMAVTRYVVQAYLRIRWRRWMTERYVGRWLGADAHYRMQLIGSGTDNPDQRIADDIDQFTLSTQQLALGLLTAITNLVSYSVVLWTLSASFTIPGTDWSVPGFLVWGALIYTAAATWLTHRIGKPLIRLNFEQQRYEADFRFSLARIREYGEQISLLDGEAAERERLNQRFGRLIGNFLAIVNRTKKLTMFQAGFGQVNNVIPYILVAPYYFAGKIPLGGMTQTASVFGQLQDTMSFFIDAYATIATYKATVDRLTGFDAAIDRAQGLASTPPRIEVAPRAHQDLEIRDLELKLPTGATIVTAPHLVLRANEATLVTGPSGSGKSTLFRAIAGIWPFGSGEIAVPRGKRLMLLPQRPYLPMGPLRGAVAYPATSDTYADERIAEVLTAVRLPQFAGRLEEEALWAQTLSLGEQQRLAVARALLAKPDWLLLDEATAALDEPTEAALYELIRERLPDTTVVSIGHRSTLIAFHDRRVELEANGREGFTPRVIGVAVPA